MFIGLKTAPSGSPRHIEMYLANRATGDRPCVSSMQEILNYFSPQNAASRGRPPVCPRIWGRGQIRVLIPLWAANGWSLATIGISRSQHEGFGRFQGPQPPPRRQEDRLGQTCAAGPGANRQS